MATLPINWISSWCTDQHGVAVEPYPGQLDK